MGDCNWPIVRETVDDLVTVSEALTLETMVLMTMLDESARRQLKGPIVCVISGGNVDQVQFPQIYL